jgi:hypothetical protein
MSIDRESELNLARDAPAAAEFLASRGGCLHGPQATDPDAWWAQLHPASGPAETFFARISWSTYPGAPPSVKFATTLTARQLELLKALYAQRGTQAEAATELGCSQTTISNEKTAIRAALEECAKPEEQVEVISTTIKLLDGTSQ